MSRLYCKRIINFYSFNTYLLIIYLLIYHFSINYVLISNVFYLSGINWTTVIFIL